MPADAFPPFDAPFGIFKRFQIGTSTKKNATINHVIAQCGAYKKTTNWRPSVHVLFARTF